MSPLVVIDPGMLATVQDLGRPGHASLGIAASGAADAVSLRLGNRLVGNPDTAAGLELTLVGGRYWIDASTTVALVGARCAARLERPGHAPQALAWWEPIAIERASELVIGAAPTGARAYLCLAGGIELPPVLGSRATHLASGIGGLEGRALVRGDRLPIGRRAVARPRWLSGDPSAIEALIFRRELRVTRGAQWEQFGEPVWTRFLETTWEIDERSDRVGLRLGGPALAHELEEILSEGVCHGDLQVPAGGSPILLGPDRPTTGGYPKIASLISADLGALGQLRARDRVRFAEVLREEAWAILAEQRALIDRLIGPT